MLPGVLVLAASPLFGVAPGSAGRGERDGGAVGGADHGRVLGLVVR